MLGLFDSVRARTTLGATAVVAMTLIAAGLAVVLPLRTNLAGQADLKAELTARETASKIATGTPYSWLDLEDAEERPVQVVDSASRVRAAGEGLQDIGGIRDSGDADLLSGDDDEELNEEDPGRGQISDDVRHTTGSATVDGHTADYRFAAVEVTTPAGETVTVYAGAGLATMRNAVGTVARSMLVGLPLLLLVVAIVTWLVTRRALRPVAAIRRELMEITSSGDLAGRVPVPRSRDEVADLAGTTNETLAALERAVTRQRGFVADAAHELRSPIASLRTQLEVSAAHPELLDVQELTDDVFRLQHLAADLLLLARLDAGERPVSAQPVDLADMVRKEVRRRPVGGRDIAVEAEVAPVPPVLGSRRRLARVLANLLDNAERHATDTIRVTLGDEEGGVAALRVADDGAGVPPADRQRIFERFVRLDEARSRDDGGAGLGLAIARDLVRAHGGEITVGQTPEGGALFEVRLPLSTSGAAPASSVAPAIGGT